ncbi:MAG TPA: hypothetical protein VKA34_15690 [Balneolales bacterium]|nr:hypothetical protein [Balneolales bacterium]
MNKFKFLIGLILISGLMMYLSIDAYAQRRPRGGWGMNNQYVRMFNPDSMVTFKGTVASVDKFTPRKGMSYGIHLKVKSSDDQIMSVHLGPAWYVNKQEPKIQVGDEIELSGSKVMYNDQYVIIASELKKGDKTLQLRDKSGIPLWAGKGMRQRITK